MAKIGARVSRLEKAVPARRRRSGLLGDTRLSDEEAGRRLLALMTNEELEALIALYDDGQLRSPAEAEELLARVWERLEDEE